MNDLFAEVTPPDEIQKLAEGAILLRRFAVNAAEPIVQTVWRIAEVSPFRHLITPGGYRMSVAMTNCGRAGWTTDRHGYRYVTIDPETGAAWPPMPPDFIGWLKPRRSGQVLRASSLIPVSSTGMSPAQSYRCTRTGTKSLMNHRSCRCPWDCRPNFSSAV
jgi:hypothetical protein